MFSRDRWQEIFETIRKNKLRTFLSGFTVALGILIFVVLFGFGNGLKNTFDKFFKDDALNTMWVRPSRTSKPYMGYEATGAFTPGCSMTHLPGFVVNADAIKAKGVDTIACMSVNDAFVMGAWGQAQNAEEIVMLADGNGDFTAAIGLSLDASGFGMGQRAQRFGMIVEDGTVTYLGIEAPGEIKVSSADAILEQL